MNRMLLTLKPTAQQQAALDALVAAQHDPASPQYQKWLTPAQFGAQFGPSDEEVMAVSAWLGSKGFRVNEVAAGRRSIEFSGTAGQVEQAFHTQMNRYDVNGVQHIANASDIAIPVDLAAVVGGVASLNDFHSRPLHHLTQTTPLTNLSGGAHALSPTDFATIYNVAPLWNNGTDGTGQSIAIVGRTNISLADVTAFRNQFGLPGNNTQIIVNGTDPGNLGGGELTEALLDVEWAGAVAKGATIKFVVSANTSSVGGDVLSSQYIVNNNVAPVLSSSFGLCEANLGSANSFFNSLWQQAAAQGISVIVAAGDSGSAGCDAAGSTTPAAHGLGISGIASTPYNLAIGGTQFLDTSAPSAYWAPGNSAGTLGSALSYIPETVWNESSYTAGSGGNSLYAGSGGVSLLYATPSWQTGSNVPAVDPGTSGGHHRYIPDVSLTGAGHDAYLIIQSGGLYGVGGTSAGAPSFAGIMALRNQAGNGRVGNPAPSLYSIAAANPASFHDVTTGTNAVPCVSGTSGCAAITASVGTGSGYSAGPGYDLATGLGSVNAAAIVANWPSGAPAAPAITSLSPNPLTASSSAQTLTINGSGFQSGSGLQVMVAGAGSSSTYANVTFASASQLQVAIVAASAGAYSVTVRNPNGQTSAAASLTVNAAGPAISSLNPNPMPGSSSAQTLTINGSGFVVAGLSVLVNGASAAVTSATATQIQVQITPGTAAATLPVKVSNASGGSATASLTVTAVAAPVISSLTPNPMPGSSTAQTLTINGSGFVTSGLSVLVNGSAVSVASATATQIQVQVTPGTSAATLPVKVLNANGSSVTASLTVTAVPAPVISSLSPNPMPGSSTAQTLTINGSGFVTSGLSVLVNGSAVSVASATTTQIQVQITPGIEAATLPVQVLNANGGSATASLNVTAAPAISSLNPNPMPGSSTPQTLTINGTGFISAGLSVLVNGSVVAVSSATATQIQVQVVPGTAAATLPVQVLNANGGSATASLSVIAAVVLPVISSLNPNPMAGSATAQTLTINGTGFIPSGLSVLVNGSAAAVTSVTATQIQVQVTPGTAATTLPVQVVNANGGSATASLTVTAAAAGPIITALNPNPVTHVPWSTLFYVYGSGFVSGSKVILTSPGATVGKIEYGAITGSSMRIQAILGNAARTWTVQVINPDGTVSNAATLQVQ